MSRLNHERPVLRVIDAGGGVRIRTIAEDIGVARRAKRTTTGPLPCLTYGTTNKIQPASPSCAACTTDTQTIARAKSKLRTIASAGGDGAPAEIRAQQARISAARARLDERKRARTSRARQPDERSNGNRKPAASTADLRSAERTAEAARRQLLLARTDWERDLLRAQHKKAQQALAAAQRLQRQRRSLR